MLEVEAVRDVSNPHETLLVVDSLTGQDAVNVAKEFNERVKVSGVVLTRMDGDGRGGAALSMRAVTGKPIKFVGMGEKIDQLEEFYPDRVAGRILGMGDIVSPGREGRRDDGARGGGASGEADDEGPLRHERSEAAAPANAAARRHVSGVMEMMPGMGKMKKQMAEGGFNDKSLKRQIALIDSMTKDERRKPESAPSQP